MRAARHWGGQFEAPPWRTGWHALARPRAPIQALLLLCHGNPDFPWRTPMTADTLNLLAQPLTAAAFAPFGHVMGVPSDGPAATPRAINGGNALRYDVLPDLQLTAEGGVPMLAIFRAQARSFPLAITEMERHRLGSQSFVPLGTQRFVVVVAAADSLCGTGDLRAFVTDGQQGVVLAPGTWHHALLAVEGGDFVVIERHAGEIDCQVQALSPALRLGL